MSGIYASPKRGKSANNVLVVICSRKSSSSSEEVNGNRRFCDEETSQSLRDFKELASHTSIELHVLEPATKEELQKGFEILQPSIVYFCVDIHSSRQDLGSFAIGGSEVCNADDIVSLFKGKLPHLVSLEISESLKLGEGLCSKGIPYVISWKVSLTTPLVLSFRQAFFTALQSSGSELWDAFHVARASFQLHSSQPNVEVSRNGKQKSSVYFPILLGKAPTVVYNQFLYKDNSEEGMKSLESAIIQIFEDPTEIRLLLSDGLSSEESPMLSAVQDGINALLTAEIRGLRLMHRMSAPLPPTAASALVRGMVTMRCDICTSNFSRVSLIVSGNAEICLKDELLEHCLKRELVNRSQFVEFITQSDNGSALRPGIRGTACIASGASTMESLIKTPAWAGQILRQLALQSSYSNLASLGIAGVDGVSVASFLSNDTGFGTLPLIKDKIDQSNKFMSGLIVQSSVPAWFSVPHPSRKRSILEECSFENGNGEFERQSDQAAYDLEGPSISGQEYHRRKNVSSESSKQKRKFLLAKMKPVPHTKKMKLVPFGTIVAGPLTNIVRKPAMPNGITKGQSYNGPPSPITANDGNYPTAAVVPPQQALALGYSATKKHGCARSSLEDCSEEEFLEDLMQFLVSRGHGRLIPTTGIDAFPNVVLNGKKLDVYNLYREVVTRGGFYVGNGINWKGQIFPKMRNHTLTNRITGVGNTLKRHYETYLLEYELAHDDVGGECCVLCYSGAEGDWVNCGVCRQWAHFGCDRRTGLGAFKDYAKTDGLEYICPRCSIRVLPRGRESDRPR